MAREGIYVGGKEIVRRYVGDKIVWRKAYYAQAFASRGDVDTQEKDGLKVEFQYHYKGGSGSPFNGTIEDGRVELNNYTAYFSRLEADIYTNSYNNRTYNRIVITFLNKSDREKFLWKQLTDANLKIFKKAYK